ncbi:MAG: IS91 family transposase [Alphaproteobacteria bacterium]|nr:IS91 family transposase [Alphaproteobacteria bacterium]
MAGDSPTLGDVIRRFGASWLHQRAATLTPAQHAVLQTLGRCHTAALGGHLYRCDHCGAERPAYNSCGNRHCPSCLGHRSAEWLEERSAELLPVPYFHVVFTVPDEVAALALGNKKVVYSILFKAASETLLEVAANPRHLGATLGFLAVLHTWTQTLLHHPHVHCIVPAGGLSPDRTRWVSTREGFLLPVPVLRRLYRGKFLAYLAEAAQAGKLQFAGATAPLAEPSAFAAFLSKQRRKKWVVYAKRPFGSPEQVLKYLAAYTHRVAISDARIQKIEGDSVTFRYRDRKDGDRQRTMTLGGVEFLRRFLLHVLPTGFVRIRYYGLFANCVRADNLAQCRALLAALKPPPPPPCPSSPQKGADDDARRCPFCGTGRMRPIRALDPTPLPDPVPALPIRRDTS